MHRVGKASGYRRRLAHIKAVVTSIIGSYGFTIFSSFGGFFLIRGSPVMSNSVIPLDILIILGRVSNQETFSQ